MNPFLHNKKIVLWVLAGLLVVLAIALRISSIHVQTTDYTIFLSPWYDFINGHGIHALADNFSNYNAPYLFFLYIATLLPLSKIVAIKLLSIIFDLVLAWAVYLIVRHFRPRQTLLPAAAAITALFLPTIFLNSSFWGQCDSIYTSLLLFSFYFLVSGRHGWGWTFWGISLAFKLQAIFFAPFILVLYLTSKDFKWWRPIYAAVAFLVLSVWPLLVGRPVGTLFAAYFRQTHGGNLTMNMPNLYQWLPNADFHVFNRIGLILSLAAGLAFVAIMVQKKLLTKYDLLVGCTLILFVMPFVLPQMHERYTYPAEIFSLLLAFVLPWRTWWLVILTEIAAFFSYIPYLFKHSPPISMQLLPLVFIAIIFYLGYVLITAKYPNKVPARSGRNNATAR